MNGIPGQRAIIDRQSLSARLDAFSDDRDGKSATTRAGVLDIVREVLAAGRDEISRRFEAGASGRDVARATSFLIDQIVRTLYDHATWHVYRMTNPTAGERLGVVAVGGYGRGEMAPYSDVDLLFLHPYKLAPWGEQVVEYLLYFLWDLGLKVGHATRSVDECLRLGRTDISIRTSILEARFVWGDRGLYDDLRRAFAAETRGTGADFVEAKLAERDARHGRLGNSRYLVEPNVKDGKGGLRDLHTLFWIAKYLYGVDSVDQLVDKEVLTRAEFARFRRAEAFLWTVRCQLHYLAGRAEERLTFDTQIELAERFRYRTGANTSAVERFMKHYYLVAKTVGDLTRIFCATLEEQHRRKSRLGLPLRGLFRRDLEGFVDERGRLSVADGEDFADPVQMIRLFRVAQEHERDIHPQALHLITRNLKRLEGAVRSDPVAAELFLDILTSPKDPETALRRMNEAGVFGHFMPEFGRVVAQMQHDMYHVYTVDEHTIRAIGILSRIEGGGLADDHPLATEIVHKVVSRRVLYLAVLLHDIAKGRGGDHSVIGEGVAWEVGARLGLAEEETETVAWLVRHHLAMSHTAMKRDINDAKTITDFVELVQSPERLRLLLVLTVADIRAVGPGRWNGWSGELLRTLYYAAEEAMAGGHGIAPRASRLAAAHSALARGLADWSTEEITAHIARCYASYWLSLDDEAHIRIARTMRTADEAGTALTVDPRIDHARAITEITVYAADHPGLFSRVTGALALSGATIVDAKIHTTTDGMAIDVFTIQGDDRGVFEGAARFDKLRATIEGALAGTIRLGSRLAERGRKPGRTGVFTVQPRVLIDNNASDEHTVIEVNGRDRAGFLYDVSRTLSHLGIVIASAHITTYGERAVDVFYVRDVFGLKVVSETKLEAIRAELLQAIGGGDERASRPARNAETASAAE